MSGLEGCRLWVLVLDFSCPGELAATAEPSLPFLLAVRDHCSAEGAVGLSAPAVSGRKTIHHLHGRLRGKPGPYLLPLSGGSTSRLLTGASAATAAARTPSGHVRAREKPKHSPPSLTITPRGDSQLASASLCFTRSQQRPLQPRGSHCSLSV